MDDSILETAPSETDYVEYDYNESSELSSSDSEINLYGPATINLYNTVVDSESEAEVSEETTQEEIFLEDIDTGDSIRVLSIDSNIGDTRTSLSTEAVKNLWTLSINGREYKVLFPVGSELDIIDGKLINRGSSNITGVVIDDSLSDSSFFNYTFTILPFSSSSTQNTLYRYGARSYLTRYYVGTSPTSLVTDVSYYNATVIDRPVGATLSRYQITIIILILAGIVVSFIGGLIRR